MTSSGGAFHGHLLPADCSPTSVIPASRFLLFNEKPKPPAVGRKILSDWYGVYFTAYAVRTQAGLSP